MDLNAREGCKGPLLATKKRGKKMQLFECFDHFMNAQNDRSGWPLPPENIESIPLMAAVVRCSGKMDECKTETDLQDAVQHTFSLLNSDELSTWSVAQECEKVRNDMEAWYDATNKHLSDIAESN